MRVRHEMFVAAAVGFALCLAAPADAAQTAKKKKQARAPAAHSMKYRQSAAAPRRHYQGGVLAGPLYNGQDYLGDDPDPNIRSTLMRDMSRYGGHD
jgi:hypothetical protein